MLKNLKRRLAGALTVLATAVLIIGLSGGTAQAKPDPIQPQQAQAMAAYGVCPSGYFCAWENIGYDGSSILFSSGWRGTCYNFQGFWNDRISSWQNYIGGEYWISSEWGCPSYYGNNLWGYNGFNVGDARSYFMNDVVTSVYFYP